MSTAQITAKRADLHLRTSSQCRRGPLAAPPARVALACLLALVGWAALRPAPAAADGPVTPVATYYQARLTHVPAGVQARVVDGYLNLWMRAPADETVVVKDFEGAPWVRFDRAGVQVNHNSEEYYLNQLPVAALVPKGVTRTTPPHWVSVTHGHSYMWREGRMHALAAVALTPGQSYVGRWSIAMTVDGHPALLKGGLWHTGAPSIVWFWPIIVMLACAVAAWRVRSPALDRRLTRILTLTLLALLAVGMAGRYLHGRPQLSAVNLILLGAILIAIGAGAGRLLSGRSGLPLTIATAVICLWAGLTLITVLTHGYVLLAVPALVARGVAAGLLGGSLSLALVGVRALDRVRA